MTQDKLQSLTQKVATAPTVYGIETDMLEAAPAVIGMIMLQQHLPFTVLKLS